ncbi:MAG: ABC transporter ATP-binding protein [Mycoplasmataceae bacterium]|nr:ABC transporter ATP-binding protein [Mycoplasmataceae bacterium]
MIKLFQKKTICYMLAAIFFLFLQSFESITESMFIGEIMEAIGPSGRQPTNNNIFSIDHLSMSQLIGTFSGMVIGGSLCGVLAIYFTTRASTSYIAYMRLKTYAKIQSLSFQDIDKISAPSLVTRLTNDTELISISFLFGLRFLISGIFLFIYGIIISLISYAELAWIYWIIIPLVLVILVIAIGLSIPSFSKSQKNTDAINKSMRETILGIRVVKAFNLKENQKNNFETSNNLLAGSTEKAFKVLGVVMPFIQSSINISIIVVLTTASESPERMMIVAPFISILMNVLFGLITIIMVLIQISRSIPSINRIKEILNWKISVNYNQDSKDIITNGEIEFRNVTHKFNESGAPAIENINLIIKPKERIGIIGGTGSGKSTFVNLMGRLFDSTEGEILIDGINIKNFSFNELNKNISIAMQNVVLFSGTIKSNIAMGLNSDLSEEEVIKKSIEAAKVGDAWEFISKKTNKLDSIVEQRGKNFSGGQKQRISIARTVAKKSNILIFDDSTSALDNVTEARVQENIANFISATTIIVAQRISSVQDLDRIIVFEDGKISDFDNHTNLLKNNKIYRDIATSQMGIDKVNEFLKGNK